MFLPSDYDNRGRLKLPALFWAVLLLQARTWALFVLAGASRGQGEALLGLFYPDRQGFWMGLAAGIPAMLTFLLSGRRHDRPRLWRYARYVLMLTQALMLASQALLLWRDAPGGIALALLALDAWALWLLASHRRLRACFDTPQP
ncbi:DUF2919 domain-containing protein [Cronobacter dublinensis]|uniref:DUF2919 domain-containing protein n=1 Tax=Cronobacter dublinensis TaxID=413497 RepID=UPI0024AF9518|nr:DUF2919 domain-containing protein [Cronobacter dublinensis]EKM6456469.1 DUF2919 domain-containing protein [Cronobacter dublinensis]EKY3202544.1 DUF2919 domain-containing protein [Cronobacter dublinensis]ELQ6156484.1 DUF2919 domain-containing protein [Cronobacter dublinensis]ELY2818638.1 DUF2919 domain-containing protein [Cronobacter dublinensis]ELY4334833.1 DUF2919 domain-containing protein [Cronobacter dublinensis]